MIYAIISAELNSIGISFVWIYSLLEAQYSKGVICQCSGLSLSLGKAYFSISMDSISLQFEYDTVNRQNIFFI